MSKTVAIIEDEPFIAEALQFLLEREGVTVALWSNGEGALDFIAKAKPDLVILDIMLPNVSGMKILQDLRADAAFEALPVLMLTAKGQAKDRQAAEEAGSSLFMTKPFANDELIENVKRMLGT